MKGLVFRKILLVSLVILLGCQRKPNSNNNHSFGKIVNFDSTSEKMDTPSGSFLCQDILTHKMLHNVGEIDTFKISEKLFSIKTAKFSISNGEGILTMSRIELYDGSDLIFEIDSVLTTGLCNLDNQRKILTVPIILFQDDAFNIVSYVYIFDLNSKSFQKIDQKLANCLYSQVCCSGEKVLYNDFDSIFTYNLNTKTREYIFDFGFLNTRILKTDLVNNSLRIYYSQDFFSDYIYNKPAKYKSIELNQNLCNN